MRMKKLYFEYGLKHPVCNETDFALRLVSRASYSIEFIWNLRIVRSLCAKYIRRTKAVYTVAAYHWCILNSGYSVTYDAVDDLIGVRSTEAHSRLVDASNCIRRFRHPCLC
eukprot:IDg12232t1